MIHNELKLISERVHFQTITMFVYYDEIFDVYSENTNTIYWYWFPNITYFLYIFLCTIKTNVKKLFI